MQQLREKLQSCLCKLGSTSLTHIGDISWLNDFCAEFLSFSNIMQKCISNEAEHDFVEIICLCLTQIIICIRYLEYTIQTENTCGSRIQASHHHFVDRISVCLKRLFATLDQANSTVNSIEGVSFLTLLDTLLDSLTDFTNPCQDDDHPVDLVLSKQIKQQIDLLLGQALSFANVALDQDKKALSALCQKVMRDCSAFQDECQPQPNHAQLKLRAMTLEHALHRLEDYINDALMRLVFTCFLDFQRISVDRIRSVLRTESDTVADEYIADFDVNLDRATQIGIFAIAFAPTLKIKTTVRSCLASFEYLDTSLIPSLQSHVSDLHSELLEQHFKEEVSKFRTALHEIIDSRVFLACYLQILTLGIGAVEKEFNKALLEDFVQMGFIVLEHFQLDPNREVLKEFGQECLQNFVRILRECKAILMCAAQVEPGRIIKRFKILRSILRKLHNTIAATDNDPVTVADPDVAGEATQSNELLGDSGNPTNLTASPSSSILYTSRKHNLVKSANKLNPTLILRPQAPGCLRRKQSLRRTAMFKRQSIVDGLKPQNTYLNQSASLEITGILDQLSCLTTSFARNLPK